VLQHGACARVGKKPRVRTRPFHYPAKILH
jgi:hypothetical protein